MAQKGFDYERNAHNVLKEYKITVGDPAGASHDKPDLSIVTKSIQTSTGCELKISPTAAGSLVLKYYNGKWAFAEDLKGDPEKIMMRDIATQYDLLKEMNVSGPAGEKWRSKVPILQNDQAGRKILTGGIKDKRKAYEIDIQSFKGENEVHITVPAKAICDYYNKKKTYYINVGTHGFYLMNKIDPLKLNAKLTKKIEDFSNCTSARIRTRCQPKGGGDYQFVMTLEFSNLRKSLYNIAPVTSQNNVTINRNAYNLADNQSLLKAFAS